MSFSESSLKSRSRSPESDLDSDEWKAAARLLCRMAREPTAILTRRLRIVTANSAFCRVVRRDEAELVGEMLGTALGLKSISHQPGHSLTRPIQGTDATGRAFRASLSVQGGGALIATLRLVNGPIDDRNDVVEVDEYVIADRGGEFGRLKSLKTRGNGPERHSGQRCFSVLYGQNEPCSGCPVVNGGEPSAHPAVLQPGLVGPYRVVEAERVSEGYRLRATDVDDATLSALQNERIERLAAHAGLSRRERDVLQLLLVGVTLREIGEALGISERTVRFHQGNLLDKLGADSRGDLLRIIL